MRAYPVWVFSWQAIVGLQLHGFSTTQSCGVHSDDHGLGAPWIDISSSDPRPLMYPDIPNAINSRQQFRGQREVYDTVASERGLEMSEMVGRTEFMNHQDANQEAFDRASEQGHTPEHKAWVVSNKQEQARLTNWWRSIIWARMFLRPSGSRGLGHQQGPVASRDSSSLGGNRGAVAHPRAEGEV